MAINSTFNQVIMQKYITILFISASTLLLGQQDSTKLNIKQVEVVKSFEAELEQANMVVVKPVMPTQPAFKPEYKYDITIVPYDFKAPDPRIKPLAMNPDGPFIVKKGFVHAGYGLRKNPDFTAGYNLALKDKYDAGIMLHYDALDNSAKNPFQKYSNFGLDIYGNYLIKENLKVFGDINIGNRVRNFYHTDLGVDTLFTDASAQRKINAYSIKAGIGNVEETKLGINYNMSMTLRNLNLTNENVRDNGISLAAHFDKQYSTSTVLGVKASYDYSAYNAIKDLSLNTLCLRPFIKTKISNVLIEGGIHWLSSNDGNSSFFPEIMVSYGLAGQKLMVFAGLQQNYFTNNFTNISKINPWVSTKIDSLQNTVFQDYYGGIKGKFAFISYQAKAGYKNVNQQMFLLNDTTDLTKFDMLYDDLGVVYISGNVEFEFSENIKLGGWLTQNIYKLDKLPKAWHTPNLEGNAYATWSLLERKLNLKSDLYFGNGVAYLDKNNVIGQSNVLFDLNFGAEYQVSTWLSVYAKAINVLDNKFQRWYGYPSVGINGMLGAKLVF